MASDSLPVKTVGTTFAVVEAIGRHEVASLDTLVSAVDASKSTVYKHLQTLIQLGYVAHTVDGYSLTDRFAALTAAPDPASDGWRADVRESLSRLTNTTGEISGLLRLDGECGEQLFQIRGDAARRRGFSVHMTPYLHASAAGKVILSQLSDDRIESILEARGLPVLADGTVTDENTLFEELARIRRLGLARASEEQAPGVRGIAAPVSWEDEESAGAVYVVGPVDRMTPARLDSDLPDLLRSTVDRLEPLGDAEQSTHHGLAIPKR